MLVIVESHADRAGALEGARLVGAVVGTRCHCLVFTLVDVCKRLTVKRLARAACSKT